MTPAVQKLCQAAHDLMRLRPAFRTKPIGAPGSAARQQQDDEIAAEDALKTAIATVLKEG